jgi:hypothetical protein
MSPSSKRPNIHAGWASTLVAIALAATSGGCVDYLARRDSIADHAGNAVAANLAIQTIDPWPPGVGRTDIPVNGRRMVDAIERYQAPRANGNGGAGAPPSFAPAVPVVPGMPAPPPQ